MSDQYKPDLVLYHGGNCADGFGAAWACWMRWGADCEYRAANYGDPPPAVEGKHVLIVDFSYKRAVLDELAQEAPSIFILDHHISAQGELEAFSFIESSPGAIAAADVGGMVRDCVELGRPPVIAVFDMERSGARMAWEFCHPEKPVPAFILHIEDRDLWRFDHEMTKPLGLWLRSEPYDFVRWTEIYYDLERPYGNDIVKEALAMQRFHDARVAEIVRFAHRRPLAGHEPVVVNCPPAFASEVAHQLLEHHPDAPFAATFYETNNRRMWSLRSDDAREDVSLIAERFGGGGHRNAAGFSTSLLSPVPVYP